MKKTVLLFVVFVCAAATGAAQTIRPSVSVVGEADMSVAPDQVVFTFDVVTTDKDISAAKQANDVSASRTLAVAKAFNIASDDSNRQSYHLAAVHGR